MAYNYLTQYNAQNYTKGRFGQQITEIIIHHWGVEGQTFEGVLNWFCNNAVCRSSAHYVVEAGRVACIVDCANTAWHASNWDFNLKTIGIECRPEATDGDYETVGELIAAIWKTYGKLPLRKHRDVPGAKTYCPGKWDLQRLQKIAEKYYSAPKEEPKVEQKAEPANHEPSEWAKQDWGLAKSIGIMDGTRPHDTMTREEVACAMLKALRVAGVVPSNK